MPSISQEVQQAIASVETEVAFGAETGFATRAAAIESVEIHVLDRLRYLEESASLPAGIAGVKSAGDGINAPPGSGQRAGLAHAPSCDPNR